MRTADGLEPPMRILMTADAVGGVWTYAVDLCRELDARGVHVLLAVMGPPPSAEQRRELSSLEHVELRSGDFRLEWMEEPWADVEAAGHWLLDLERQYAPDVVHLNGYCHAALPWRAPVLVVAHSCVLSWWRAVKGEEAPPAWERYAREVRRGLRAARLVAAPSMAMLDALRDHYGPLPRASVVPNGRPAGPDTGQKEPFILTAGRLWDPAKNVSAVCAVASRLAWPTYVAGDTVLPGNEAVQHALCDAEHLTYLGRLPASEVRDWMARASIYVLPARYEPFGLSVLEAAHAGCALVLGDIRSLREIWHEAAVYVAPDDHQALATALSRLIDEPTLRAQLADRARARARHLTSARMGDTYYGLYRELAGELRPVLSLSAV